MVAFSVSFGELHEALFRHHRIGLVVVCCRSPPPRTRSHSHSPGCR